MGEGPVVPELLPVFTELRGERVVLRPPRDEDADAMHAAVQESLERLRPWLPWAASSREVADSLSFIRRSQAGWATRQSLNVGIWSVADGGYLGGAGLHARDWEVPAFEIGYWLRTSAEGHGYMLEAVRLLTTWAFATWGAQRILIRCDARNRRSAAVAERLGFVREALLRNDTRTHDGDLRDTLVYARTPEDAPPAGGWGLPG